MTYQALYISGWRATVRASSRADAQRRLETTGRGERFKLTKVADTAFAVWGRDHDDDYEDGE